MALDTMESPVLSDTFGASCSERTERQTRRLTPRVFRARPHLSSQDRTRREISKVAFQKWNHTSFLLSTLLFNEPA